MILIYIYFRQDVGLSHIYRLDSPATCERIRILCQDQIVSAVRDTSWICEEYTLKSSDVCYLLLKYY